LLSLSDLEREEIEELLERAAFHETSLSERRESSALRGRILATLFFQPSTRTRLSFEAAMLRLGGEVIGFADGELSRSGSTWSEPLCDTARVVAGYADVIVMRHGDVGAARELSDYSHVPVLNAGDGIGAASEHPSQGLLDLYSIRKNKGRLDGLCVAIIGGVHQRAAHSLLIGLSRFDDVKIKLVSPDHYRLSAQELARLKASGLDIQYAAGIEDVIPHADVIYHNGMSENPDEGIDDRFLLTPEKARGREDALLVLHPLPRAGEITHAFDNLKCAGYFAQSAAGVPLRMALLESVLLH